MASRFYTDMSWFDVSVGSIRALMRSVCCVPFTTAAVGHGVRVYYLAGNTGRRKQSSRRDPNHMPLFRPRFAVSCPLV